MTRATCHPARFGRRHSLSPRFVLLLKVHLAPLHDGEEFVDFVGHFLVRHRAATFIRSYCARTRLINRMLDCGSLFIHISLFGIIHYLRSSSEDRSLPAGKGAFMAPLWQFSSSELKVTFCNS